MQLCGSLKNRFRLYIHKNMITVLRKRQGKKAEDGILGFLLGRRSMHFCHYLKNPDVLYAKKVSKRIRLNVLLVIVG
jgi:hypothetical protein